jgi:hypothetical protein
MSGRGRGRRAKDQSQLVGVVQPNEVVSDPPPAPRGRGGRKKQFPVVALITPEGIEGNLQPESRRPLIAHLPIQSRNVTLHDEPLKYDPAPPNEVEPFGSFLDNPFNEQSEFIVGDTTKVSESNDTTNSNVVATEQDEHKNSTAPVSSQKVDTIDYYRKGQLLVQFRNTEEIRKIPESSVSACFWCCHTFETQPVILPMKDHGEYITVFGNFCCPECAMAYLFDNHQDSHTRWEQLALLNRIYAESCNGKIQPAPPRSVLKHFGGLYSIQEYRALIRQQKVRIDVHLPPMVSILATMDTKPIDFYDVSLTKNVMETVKERLQKAEEVLKLRRTKPLKAWESTLDACINLKVGIA